MPKFHVEVDCRSCNHSDERDIEVENTSGPEDDDMNAEGAPECPSCGDVDWLVMGYEEVKDAGNPT